MKHKIKILLDIIMLLAVLTLFNKKLISMKYHEVVGLILIAIIVIHIVLNIKTIFAMCKNFRKIPITLKVGVIVDILLIFCFSFIGISGILISHTVLTEISSQNILFKIGHIFAGGISVILLGIHIGLHICRRPMPKLAAIVISIITLCCGIYGVIYSDEIRFITMPFTTTSMRTNNIPDNENLHQVNDEFQKNAENQDLNNQENLLKDKGINKRKGYGNGYGKLAGQRGGKKKNIESLSTIQKLENIFMFLGMIFTCAMITYWIAVPKNKKII